MNASLQTVTFTINGREVQALRHETLIEVADREGIDIPRLCYAEGLEAVGNCRSCMVEIDGERTLAPSC
jgi:formate dehydrogenase major subunit